MQGNEESGGIFIIGMDMQIVALGHEMMVWSDKLQYERDDKCDADAPAQGADSSSVYDAAL